MKKMYIQPAVEQMQLLSQSMMQAGSPSGVVGVSNQGTDAIGGSISPENPLVGN